MVRLLSLDAALEVKVPGRCTSTEIAFHLKVLDDRLAPVRSACYFSSNLASPVREYSDETETEKVRISSASSSAVRQCGAPVPLPSSALPAAAFRTPARASATTPVISVAGGAPLAICSDSSFGRKVLNSGAMLIAEVNGITCVKSLAPASVVEGCTVGTNVFATEGAAATIPRHSGINAGAVNRQQDQMCYESSSLVSGGREENFDRKSERNMRRRTTPEEGASHTSAGRNTVTFDLQENGQPLPLQNKQVFLTLEAHRLRYYPEFDMSIVHPVDVTDLDLDLTASPGGTVGVGKYREREDTNATKTATEDWKRTFVRKLETLAESAMWSAVAGRHSASPNL